MCSEKAAKQTNRLKTIHAPSLFYCSQLIVVYVTLACRKSNHQMMSNHDRKNEEQKSYITAALGFVSKSSSLACSAQ